MFIMELIYSYSAVLMSLGMHKTMKLKSLRIVIIITNILQNVAYEVINCSNVFEVTV